MSATCPPGRSGSPSGSGARSGGGGARKPKPAAGGGRAPNADTVAGLEPDIAVVATGSEPDDRYSEATSTMDVLLGVEIREGPVVVVDEEGHRKGTGVAEVLAAGGREV